MLVERKESWTSFLPSNYLSTWLKMHYNPDRVSSLFCIISNNGAAMCWVMCIRVYPRNDFRQSNSLASYKVHVMMLVNALNYEFRQNCFRFA